MKINASLSIVARIIAFGMGLTFSSETARANSATWNASPANGVWDVTSQNNWSTGAGTFPGATSGTASTDIAAFLSSSTTAISINSTTLNAKGITFGATSTALSSFTIGSTNGSSLFLTSGGTVQIVADTTPTNTTETINAPIVIEGGYIFQNNNLTASNVLNFGGTITNGTASGITILTIQGTNTGANTISGVISDGGSSVTSLNKTGVGTWTFSGANTYTSVTRIRNGILSVSTLNSIATNAGLGTTHSASSNLGAPTSVGNGTISLGDLTTMGTLLYTGTGETTDRVISLAGQTGGATIDQSGSGLLKFTSAFTASVAGAKTLTLQGSTTGMGELDGAIIDSSSGATSLAKKGTNTWIVAGASSYTGGTTITSGKLLANDTTASTSSTGTGAVSIGSGGTLGGKGFIAPSGVTSGTAIDVAGALSPGNGNEGTVSGTGTLTFVLSGTSSVKLETGATFTFDLKTTATSDAVVLTGGSTTGALVLNLQQITDFTFNQLTGFGAGTYVLFDTSAANDISGALGATVSESLGGGFMGTLVLGNDINGHAALNLLVTVVPEPSSWVMMLGGLAVLVAWHRRKRNLS